MLRTFFFLSLLLILISACAPKPPEEVIFPTWKYADLRAIDAPEETTTYNQPALSPSHDLLAIYTRDLGAFSQIRLDLLDISPVTDYTLFLALDTQEGGNTLDHLIPAYYVSNQQSPGDFGDAGQPRWDYLLVVPFNNLVSIIDAGSNITYDPTLQVERDDSLDTVTITFDRTRYVPGKRGYWAEAMVAPVEHSAFPGDILRPVHSAASPPPPAETLLVFWNTFSAVTPAMALRAWDGAHTGPYNDRHGLRHLLEAAGASRIPLILLDLDDPVALSALDYVGGLSFVHQQSEKGLIYLTYGYAQLPAFHLAFIPGVTSLGIPLDNNAPAGDASLALDQLTAGFPSRLYRWQDYRLLPLPTVWQRLPDQPEQQATRDGPALALRKALASLAYSASQPGSHSPFLLLGGDLNRSAWGDSRAAHATFSYLASHPWVRFLSPADLLDQDSLVPYPLSGEKNTVNVDQESAILDLSINGTPPCSLFTNHCLLITDHCSLITDSSLNTEHCLLNTVIEEMSASLQTPIPPETPQLAQLRLNYTGQIGHLLTARRWISLPLEQFCGEAAPPTTGSCWRIEDSDQDSQDEYLLASGSFFGVFESQGGYLTSAFVRTQTGLHQVVAPTWQFTVGLADPSTWDMNAGLAGDPSQLRGAFSDIPLGYLSPSWQPYLVALAPGSITFTSPDGQVSKTIRLTPAGLEAQYTTSTPLRVQIPLALDSWRRYEPNWGWLYQGEVIPHGWLWRVLDTPMPSLMPSPYPLPQGEGDGNLDRGVSCQVAVTSDAPLEAFSFTASRDFIGQPEDPFFDYTRGHLLPFPFALVEVTGEGIFTIRISLYTTSYP